MGDPVQKLDLTREAQKLRRAIDMECDVEAERLRLAMELEDNAKTYLWDLNSQIAAKETKKIIATADSKEPPTTASVTVTALRPPKNRGLLEIVESDCALLAGKQADYASEQDPWVNFRESAEFVNKTRGLNVTPLDIAYMLLGVKISRLRNLGQRRPMNESITETLKDLRGYSAIIQAMEEETHG